MRHQQPQRVLLVGADLPARVYLAFGDCVRRQLPLAVERAHLDFLGEYSGPGGFGVGALGIGCNSSLRGFEGALVDGVEEVADVDVDGFEGLD